MEKTTQAEQQSNKQFIRKKKNRKSMKKTNVLLLALVLLGGVFFLTGCQEDNVDIITEETALEFSDPEIKKEIDFLYEQGMIDQDVYQKLLQLPAHEVLQSYEKEENDEVVKVEYYRIGNSNDTDGITIQRKVIQELMENEESDSLDITTMRMRRATHMYDSNGGTITCRVFVSSGNGRTALPSVWRTALEDAVDEWNNLNLNVSFNVVNASSTNIVGGYVNVFAQSIANHDNWWAGADVPGDPGYFGERLIINTTTTNQTPTADARVKMMVHELGHIIGFYHTNDPVGGDVYYTTPTCNEPWWDPSRSFMYATQSHNEGWSNNGFSSCDLTNLEHYWW